MARWMRVSFAGDCTGGDDLEPGDECSVCGGDYVDCPCPGPTQEDKFEYREINGVLYARPKKGISVTKKSNDSLPESVRSVLIERGWDEPAIADMTPQQMFEE